MLIFLPWACLKVGTNITKVPNLSAATGSMAEYKHRYLKNIHRTGNKNDRMKKGNLTTGSCLKHYFKTASTSLSMLNEVSSSCHQSAGLTTEMKTTSPKAHHVL